MYQDSLAARYAPDVALPPYGEWATPDTQAGLSPENLYDESGTPLNYFQEQGGPRQFLVPQGQQAYAEAPGNAALQEQIPLRGRTPAPIAGLRGPTQPNSGTQQYDSPIAPEATGPADLMRRPPAQARPSNMGNISPGGLTTLAEADNITPPNNRAVRRTGPSASLELPPVTLGEMDNLPRANNGVNPSQSIRNEFNAGTVRGTDTLQRLLESSGFDLSSFLSRYSGRASDTPGRPPSRPGAEMESTLRPIADPRADLMMIDQEPTSARPSVTPTASMRWNGQVTQVGPDQQAGRAEEVAAMLRANNIRVTSVTRNNNASPHGHPAGNSIDVDPSDRIRARNLILQYYPGLLQESFDISAGQEFGNGVRSTGNHAHFDLGPVAGPRRRQPQRR